MAAPTRAQLATARDFLARAGRRIDVVLHDDGRSKGFAPEDVPDVPDVPYEPDEVFFDTIRRFKGMEREVVVLVEVPVTGDRLDELLYVGLTRSTTDLVVIAPPELVRQLA